MSGTPTLRQNSFRFRIDGKLIDVAPTWTAAENANWFPGLDVPFRLRIAYDNTGTGTASNNVLMVSKNGAAYQRVINTSTISKCVEMSATGATQTILTVQRLTSGAGTWGNGSLMEGSSNTAMGTANLSGFTEGEASLQINSADVTAGDVLTFRAYATGPVAFTTYNQTPSLTVPAADSAPTDPTTYFFSNTASDLTVSDQTGTATSKSLAASGATSGTFAPTLTAWGSGTADMNADATFFAPADIPGAGGSSNAGKYSTVSIDITTGNSNIRYIARLIRVNSLGVTQAWGAGIQSTSGATGVYTFNCSWNGLGTWASGDRLRVDVRLTNNVTNTASQTATLTYSANSWVAFLATAPVAPFMFPRSRHYVRR